MSAWFAWKSVCNYVCLVVRGSVVVCACSFGKVRGRVEIGSPCWCIDAHCSNTHADVLFDRGAVAFEVVLGNMFCRWGGTAYMLQLTRVFTGGWTGGGRARGLTHSSLELRFWI